MITKKLTLMAVLTMGAVLVISGCSGPNGNNSSDQNNPSANNANAQEEANSNTDSEKTVIYFFWGDGCPHCAKQKPWLEELEEEYPDLEVKMFETYRNRDNAQKFQEMAQSYGIRARGVPATFIGDFDPIVGFSESMKPSIENKIETCLNEGCIDPGSKL